MKDLEQKLDEILIDAYKDVCDEHYNEGDFGDQNEEARDWLYKYEGKRFKQALTKLIIEAIVYELKHTDKNASSYHYIGRPMKVKDRIVELEAQLKDK